MGALLWWWRKVVLGWCSDCDGEGKWTQEPYGVVTCAWCEGSGRRRG